MSDLRLISLHDLIKMRPDPGDLILQKPKDADEWDLKTLGGALVTYPEKPRFIMASIRDAYLRSGERAYHLYRLLTESRMEGGSRQERWFELASDPAEVVMLQSFVRVAKCLPPWLVGLKGQTAEDKRLRKVVNNGMPWLPCGVVNLCPFCAWRKVRKQKEELKSIQDTTLSVTYTAMTGHGLLDQHDLKKIHNWMRRKPGLVWGYAQGLMESIVFIPDPPRKEPLDWPLSKAAVGLSSKDMISRWMSWTFQAVSAYPALRTTADYRKLWEGRYNKTTSWLSKPRLVN